MTEQWKDVKGYEGLYIVSDCGEVRNARRNKRLSPAPNSTGYDQVVLCKNGKQKHFLISRLVAAAFLPGFKSSDNVDHRDRNNKNNTVNNLRIADQSRNSANRGVSRNKKSSKYKGVFFSRGSFLVYIMKNGKSYYLGSFKKEKEAARVYDEKARELFPLFNLTNAKLFPDDFEEFV